MFAIVMTGEPLQSKYRDEIESSQQVISVINCEWSLLLLADDMFC